MDKVLFTRILVGERKRADRSGQPLAVMVLAAHGLRTADAAVIWRAAIEAVAASIRGTDILGWIDRPRAIGVILHEASGHDAQLEQRVRQQLCRRLSPDTAAQFQIRVQVHSPSDGRQQSAAEPIDWSLLGGGSLQERTSLYEWIKRVWDVLGSAILLIVLSPVFLLIAVLIKLKSPGPVFYRQARVGRMLKPFEMLKFRTMHVNADHTLHQDFVSQFIKSSGQDCPSRTPGFFKLVGDPRVTSIGRVLRKTSLDELPQLWNVLRGDMSLVGPRPPLPYEVEQYKPWHTRRVIEAQPGITGLWQVGGRSRTTFDDMVRLDLRYARTRSCWTDLKILLATPGAVFSGKGAC
jgi:lipopolysaccharide/colanic/teichoic acid biosynthesis glycosyltransferase